MVCFGFLNILLEALIGCSSTTRSRRSVDYACRPRLAFGPVASIIGVIEPQASGRLHWHLNIFSSIINPTILSLLAASSSESKNKIASFIDSVVTTYNDQEIYDWFNSESSKMIRAADLTVPSANDFYDEFMNVGRKKALLTGYHTHGFTCQQLPKGRYQCRLAMPRGIHPESTGPIHIQLKTASDHKSGQRSTFVVKPITSRLKSFLLEPQNFKAGVFCREHPHGPIIWEQRREEKDKYFVEQNLLITNLIECHNNVSFVSGLDAGEGIEEYLISYFQKEAASLKQAAAVLLAAIEHIHIHPSKAEDKNTLSRNAKYLAQRTINSFAGSHQWSLPVMASALLGHRSHVTSDTYRYIFAHDNVWYKDKQFNKEKINKKVIETITDKTNEHLTVHECLDALNDVDEDTFEKVGGTRAFHVKSTDQIILLTQAESYRHRGPWFANMNPLEFECVVELIERCLDVDQQNRRRPRRPRFDLGVTHPLFKSHQGVIRMKMHTAILAGRPPPAFPGNKPKGSDADTKSWQVQMEYFSKYMLDLLVPWNESSNTCFSRDANGFISMSKNWNSSKASLINRQRYQYLSNIMNKSHRSSRNATIATSRRERNVDLWCKANQIMTNGAETEVNDKKIMNGMEG